MKRRLVSLCVLFVLLTLSSHSSLVAADDSAAAQPRRQTCSSFGLNNQGSLVFGTNYDNYISEGLLYVNKRNVAKRGWKTDSTGAVAAWVSRYGSVTFNQAGYQLVWGGMNEAGLVISTMALDETQSPALDARPPLQSSYWVQYQLDNSGTVAEVIASDATIRISNTVDHYLVCDRTATCAVIEFLDGQMVVHTAGDLPVSALTNNLYEESVAAWQSSRASHSAPTDESLFRFYTAAEQVSAFDPLVDSAVDYAFATLAAVSDPATQWSIVFDPEQQRAYFRTKHNQDIRSIDFTTFDFSCRAPVQMLNIHALLAGEVSDDFVAYNRTISLEHLLGFLTRTGRIPALYSEEQVQGILALFERFPCMG